MNSSKALKKIQKLLNLAKSDNPNEAATALRQAKALMDKHNLTIEAIKLAKINTKSFKVKRKTVPTWERHLISVVSGYCCVDCIWTVRRAGRQANTEEFSFIGIGNKPLIASYIFDYLSCCVLLARKGFLTELKTRHTYRIKKLADSFCEGWVIGVGSNVREFINGPEGEEKALIEKYMSEKNVADKKLRAQKEKSVGQKAAQALGYREGMKTKINHGVGAPEPQVLLE